jgi:hypothetical protein
VTYVGKIPRFAKVEFDGSKLVRKIDVFYAGGMNQSNHLLLEMVAGRGTEVGEIDG